MVPLIYSVIAFFYTTLQSRYIFGGDSAEYATVARTWSIAHPPGYPLYSLLTNIVNSIIPFGTTPWKVALLSSIPTVITAYFIYKILCLVKLHKYSAFAASLLYLFLFPIWQYALIPEVFGLHTMFISLITYFLLRFISKNDNKFILLASFFCGLCVSHHHIFVLFIPGWLYLLKDRLKKILSNRLLLIKITFSVLLGVSFYFYAIIVSHNNAILDWENAKTLEGLFRLVTRSSYGSFKAYSTSAANIVNQLADMVSGLVFILLDFKPLGIIFILVGLFTSRKYAKQFSYFLAISLAVHFAFLFYTNFTITNSISSGMFERFLIPIYVILVFLFGAGIDYTYQKYILSIAHIIRNKSLKKVVKGSYLVFICIYIALVAVQNFKTIALIANTKAFDQFGKDLLNTVPPNGILSTQGDTSTFTSSYHNYGLKEREDIVLLHLGLMGRPNFIDMLKKKYPSLVVFGPIKNNDDFNKFITRNSERGYYSEREQSIGTWRPYGLLWKYYTDNLSAASDSAKLLADNKKFWEKTYIMPELSSDEINIFHLDSVGEYYLTAYQNYAKLLVFMNKYEEAEVVLRNIALRYKKGNPQSAAEYMNVLILEKKCIEATQIATTIGLERTIEKYPGFVKSALSYLQTCEPHNSAIPKYKKQLLELEKKAKTDLDSF